MKNGRQKKKKNPDLRLAFLGVTRRTGNTFLLKDGLSIVRDYFSYNSFRNYFCFPVARDSHSPVILKLVLQGLSSSWDVSASDLAAPVGLSSTNGRVSDEAKQTNGNIQGHRISITDIRKLHFESKPNPFNSIRYRYFTFYINDIEFFGAPE